MASRRRLLLGAAAGLAAAIPLARLASTLARPDASIVVRGGWILASDD